MYKHRLFIDQYKPSIGQEQELTDNRTLTWPSIGQQQESFHTCTHPCVHTNAQQPILDLGQAIS